MPFTLQRFEIPIQAATTDFTIIFPVTLEANIDTLSFYLGSLEENTDYTSKPYKYLSALSPV
jgi:hypothetical protein